MEIAVGTRLDEVERQLIQRTLDTYPTVKESARVLGIGLRTLHTQDPPLQPAQPPHVARGFGTRGRPPARGGLRERHLRAPPSPNEVPDRHFGPRRRLDHEGAFAAALPVQHQRHTW